MGNLAETPVERVEHGNVMSDPLMEALKRIIVEIAEVDEVPAATPFADLGIDSMMAIEIVADVEKEYDLTIAEDELNELTHLQAVYDKVKEKLAEKS